MTRLYPFRFQPILRRYLWGGRRLGSVLGKPIGTEEDYAESWEVVDHGLDQSVVAFGDLAGSKLNELVRNHGDDLLGDHAPQRQFPLLFKFLDAHRTLSVQVHPDDEQAARLDPPDLGKTEAWYVIAAQPESRIYAGLKPHIDREMLAEHLAAGTCEECLHSFEPQAGECLLIPAGTVHAIGSGLLIAEIQQASDATFRLFDWNRLDAAGNPRPLHIEASLEAIDFERGPVGPQAPQPTENPHLTRLAKCDKFVLDRWQFAGQQTVGGDRRFHVLAIVSGTVRISGDPCGEPLGTGSTVLVPAAGGTSQMIAHEDAVVLDMYLP